MLFREGQPAPGVQDDAVFSNLELGSTPIAMNSSGEVLIPATLQGSQVDSSNNSGLWLHDGDEQVVLVAREGTRAPGVLDDAYFGRFDSRSLEVTDSGQVFFLATLEGPGIGLHNDAGLWGLNQAGDLTLIVREGDEVLVDTGSESPNRKTIETLTSDFAVNKRGQVSFIASFTDGATGILISNAVVSLPGDYNLDGVVDAGDYVVWRDNVGAPAGALPNDSATGPIGEDQYLVWRQNFGAAAHATPESQPASAPEPGAFTLLIAWGVFASQPRRSRNSG